MDFEDRYNSIHYAIHHKSDLIQKLLNLKHRYSQPFWIGRVVSSSGGHHGRATSLFR